MPYKGSVRAGTDANKTSRKEVRPAKADLTSVI